MHISMIDPSLFTIPYDRALMTGLVQSGHSVKLHGRRIGPDDNSVDDINLDPDFYHLTSRNVIARLPKLLRLNIKGLDHIASMLRLKSKLRATRPDVIHFQWLPLPMIDGRMLAGFRKIAPLILTVHDTNPFNGNPSSAMQSRGFSNCLLAFDQLIVHTQQGRERMLALGIPESQVSVLPFGLMEELPPAVVSMPMDGPLTFLLFGKLKPYKGIDVLLEAFALLPDELRSQARIRVVGKAYMPLAPFYLRAKALGIAHKIVFEPEFIADQEVNELFSSDVIAVFPYREIEASAVLPFALANGRPVIASSIGEFAEKINDNVHGLLVPPDDPAALATAMSRMIRDRKFAVQCSMRARELAEVTPSWQAIAQQTVEVYGLAKSRTDRGGASGAQPGAGPPFSRRP